MLALIAMAVRALVPANYMLSPEPGRFVAVAFCNGVGQAGAVLDLETGKLHPAGRPRTPRDGDGSHAQPCAFAATAHLATPEAGPRIDAPADEAAESETIAPVTAHVPGLAAPPPWSTGPPASL